MSMIKFPHIRFWLASLFSLGAAVAAHAVTVSNSVCTATLTASGSSIVVFTSVGVPQSGYFERIWVCTQTPAQIAAGFNGIYPIQTTAIPVQRFSDMGGQNSSGTITIATLGAGSRVWVFMGKFQVGTNAQISTASGGLQFPLLPQTVTVTPSTDSIFQDEQSVLTASGAQNGYSWSLTGGGGIIYTGNTAIFTPSAVGTWTVSVWSPEGNGYAESNIAHATITVTAAPPSDHKANIVFDNRQRDKTAYFKVWQKGRVVHSETVEAGDWITKTVTLTDGSNYTVTFSLNKDGTGLHEEGIYTVDEETKAVTGTPTDVSRGDPPATATADTAETDSEGNVRDLGTVYVDANKKKAPDEGDQPDADKTAGLASSVKGKLPHAPSILVPGGSNGVYEFSMTIPGVEGSYAFRFDLSSYQTGILIFRSLVKAAMTVYFFFLCLRAVREAAA